MTFGQEDFNAECLDEDRRILDYISSHINHPRHDGCVYLKLCDYSDAADDYVKSRHIDNSVEYAWVELLVTPEDIKEVRKLMLKLMRQSEERMYE